MERNTSTEFIRWNKYLDDKDWHESSKTDYMLAQIAFFVYRIEKMLGGKGGAMPEFEQFLIKFNNRDGSVNTTELSTPAVKYVEAATAEESAENFAKGFGLPGFEIEDRPVLSPKWQKINAEAKAAWAGVFGIKPSQMPKAGEVYDHTAAQKKKAEQEAKIPGRKVDGRRGPTRPTGNGNPPAGR